MIHALAHCHTAMLRLLQWLSRVNTPLAFVRLPSVSLVSNMAMLNLACKVRGLGYKLCIQGPVAPCLFLSLMAAARR